MPLAFGLLALGLSTTVAPSTLFAQEPAERGVAAILRGLDKVNGHHADIEVQVGGSAEIYGLIVTLAECRYPVANPTGDAYAYLTIRDPLSGEVFFDGWMIASSPALSALDHARYDVWVIRCNSSAGEGS
ncbi:DUF2155 domain-containing protein [Pseudophaeobacter sp.]|uniref:DUF2155 domain-containing protein n=1 Tax=Pseudophaeobacter sp. TaxID=1971739 RepID=UPI0021FF4DDE|nr:DUF2155 domain-containing protein [Phaeobacter sp. G2]